jgi:hypothetical protein
MRMRREGRRRGLKSEGYSFYVALDEVLGII